MDALVAELTAARKRHKEQEKAVAATKVVLAHAQQYKMEALEVTSRAKLKRQSETLAETEKLVKELEQSLGQLPLGDPGKPTKGR